MEVCNAANDLSKKIYLTRERKDVNAQVFKYDNKGK